MGMNTSCTAAGVRSDLMLQACAPHSNANSSKDGSGSPTQHAYLSGCQRLLQTSDCLRMPAPPLLVRPYGSSLLSHFCFQCILVIFELARVLLSGGVELLQCGSQLGQLTVVTCEL